jgi:signal transduction histidine kinase
MALARRRRRALGLRGRIVGVVLFTAVATLGVSAIALLGPLEHSLRSDALQSLRKDVKDFGVARQLRHLNLRSIPYAGYGRSPSPYLRGQAAAAHETLTDLGAMEDSLDTEIGGSVYLFEYPGILLTGDPSQRADAARESFPDVQRAFAEAGGGKPLETFGTVDGTENAREAIPYLSPAGIRYVLAVRKPIYDIATAVQAVGRAFLYAALAALGLTLLLAIPLSDRLARRLRTLRQAALQIAAGGRAVQVPVDRAQDEVGDLSRSFATMQRRLEHQEQARRAFVSTASHELRTPLTSLEGMLELLDDDLAQERPDLDDARELLSSARAQSRRLAQLAADLLDLSRLDAEVALRSEPVELAELARAVLAEFQLGTRSRGVSTAMEDLGQPVWALGDPGSIARILRILLDNAVRISPAGGEVSVELQAQPRPALRVRDQGPGVDPGERELIFERFHRGRATAGDAGFGLGLAIGRELAERMGGALVLEPPDGGGAVFTLTLRPAGVPHEDPAAVR